MANFDTETKVIIKEIDDRAFTAAGSLAKAINDHIETIDDANLVDIQAVKLDGTRIAYIVVSKV
tara:strand:+ start:693 stop:884 length:192 start_codon:yes stop_codon:yes gene_type:complete